MTFGWYAGTEWKPIGGPMVPLCKVSTSITEAAFRRMLTDAGFVPILDEQEKSSSTDLPALLRLLRAVSFGGGHTVRAKYAGEGVVYEHISCPVIVASIDPISSDEADLNRWLVTETDRDPRRTDPEDAIAAYWQAKGPVDLKELRRTVFLSLLQRPQETRQAYEDVRHGCADIAHGMESRFRENIYPLLATAKVLGLEWQTFGDAIFGEKVQDQVTALEQRVGTRLLDMVMTAQIDPRVRGTSGYDTLAEYLHLATLPVVLPSQGVALVMRRCRDAMVRPHLAVRWESVKATLLRGTDFGDLSTVKLNQIARTVPGFVDGPGGKSTHPLQLRGMPKMRWVLIELPDDWSTESPLFDEQEVAE
jgi:hypothetical protein